MSAVSLNASFPMDWIPLVSRQSARFLQPENALLPIVFRDFGRTTFASSVRPVNAESGTIVAPSRNVTVRLPSPSVRNARLSIFSMLLPIETVCSAGQFANAPDKPVEVYAAPETYEEPENFTQPEYNSEESFYTQPEPQQVYTNMQPQSTPALPPKAKVFGIISFVFGLISIVWSWVGILPIVGQILGFIFLAMAIVGIVLGSKSLQLSNFRLARIGRVLCIVGLIFVVLCLIIGIAALASGVYEDIYDNMYDYIEDVVRLF